MPRQKSNPTRRVDAAASSERAQQPEDGRAFSAWLVDDDDEPDLPESPKPKRRKLNSGRAEPALVQAVSVKQHEIAALLEMVVGMDHHGGTWEHVQARLHNQRTLVLTLLCDSEGDRFEVGAARDSMLVLCGSQ